MITTNHSPIKNTFGIDVRAKRFIEFASPAELLEALSLVENDRMLVVGACSNILFTGHFDGLILHSAIKGIEKIAQDDETVTIRVGSGETWDHLVEQCLLKGWYGLENLSIIPGEVGASAVQNIGAYGVEAKDFINSVCVVDVNTHNSFMISATDCQYGYRYSRFKGDWKDKFVIVSVTFRLPTTFIPHTSYGNIREKLSLMGISHPCAKDVRAAVVDIRRERLPNPDIEGNAGSFFTNPIVSKEEYKRLMSEYPNMPHYTLDDGREKIPAGWLIEQCGWKGKQVGRAGVHHKQALVIVNKGGATANDILHLKDSVTESVRERFGISLTPEVLIV